MFVTRFSLFLHGLQCANRSLNLLLSYQIREVSNLRIILTILITLELELEVPEGFATSLFLFFHLSFLVGWEIFSQLSFLRGIHHIIFSYWASLKAKGGKVHPFKEWMLLQLFKVILHFSSSRP
mmetsp:Transcript_33555/g.32616  ORF Transcript_33555/g.32616 Transcript_33555/m.32616 type:complete len:124 (+) Transcript_33555:279-650(+)